jgi:hypothetical protein
MPFSILDNPPDRGFNYTSFCIPSKDLSDWGFGEEFGSSR